jgi:hypothetical protein
VGDTLLPISVAVIYLATVAAILIDSGVYSKRMLHGATRAA